MRKKSKQMITRFSRTEIWLYLSHVRLNGAERYRRNRRFSVNKGVTKNFAKFTGKLLCYSLVFNKVSGLRKFLRTPFLQNTSGRMLLEKQQGFDLIGSYL